MQLIFQSVPDHLIDQDDLYVTDLDDERGNSYTVFVPESAWDEVEHGDLKRRAFRRILQARAAPPGEVA